MELIIRNTNNQPIYEQICTQIKAQIISGKLAPGEAPNVGFTVGEGDRAEAVYAFCNLHGLWKTDL